MKTFFIALFAVLYAYSQDAYYPSQNDMPKLYDDLNSLESLVVSHRPFECNDEYRVLKNDLKLFKKLVLKYQNIPFFTQDIYQQFFRSVHKLGVCNRYFLQDYVDLIRPIRTYYKKRKLDRRYFSIQRLQERLKYFNLFISSLNLNAEDKTLFHCLQKFSAKNNFPKNLNNLKGIYLRFKENVDFTDHFRFQSIDLEFQKINYHQPRSFLCDLREW